MHRATHSHDPASDLTRLREETVGLREENVRLAALIADLQEKLSAALAENERLRSGGKGSAAPFSKGKPKQNPQKPGRKPGQGKFTNRPAPDYPRCDVTDATAAVDTPVCPDCGGEWGLPEYEEASTIDLPEMPQPKVKRFVVEKRRCTCCSRVLRGTHPDLKPDQFGATAHRVDDRVYLLAHWLHYGLGLPVRKIPEFLARWMRIPLTQSAMTQDALRRVGPPPAAPVPELPDHSPAPPAPTVTLVAPVTPVAPVAPAGTGSVGQIYQQLRGLMGQEATVHTDDTSWRIGGAPAWLMAFCSARLVVYQVRRRHRNEEVREILGALFAGVMICDRGRSYDATELRAVRQQKCLSHLIHNITDELPGLTGEARRTAETLRDLLRQALALWHAYHRGETEGFEAQAQELCRQVDVLLAPVTHVNPILDRLLNGIGRQHDRGHLLRFLADPTIEPTNNRGERILRPSVIARKVSQCSRTDGGAAAHAAWCSLIGTLRGLGSPDLIQDLLTCMREGKMPGLEQLAPLPSGSSAAR